MTLQFHRTRSPITMIGELQRTQAEYTLSFDAYVRAIRPERCGYALMRSGKQYQATHSPRLACVIHARYPNVPPSAECVRLSSNRHLRWVPPPPPSHPPAHAHPVPFNTPFSARLGGGCPNCARDCGMSFSSTHRWGRVPAPQLRLGPAKGAPARPR